MTGKRTLWELSLGLALLLGMVLIPGGTAQARSRNNGCTKRIERQEQKLHKEIRSHGERSRQAAKAREKLHALRANCDARRNHSN